MKKLISIMAGSLIFCTILIGCTGSKGCFSQYKCTENLKKNSWNVSYEKFDGSKYINIKLKEDEVKPFRVNVESESGELDLVVRDGKRKVVFEELNISTSSFEVPIKERGKYKIKFNGRNHKGSFDVVWK
ncbi:hypothetical protein GNF80_10625 [Clostridium perfringens]|nr:hypothetical protein [Clostridium perfringens]